jgi:hypothetical protein
VDQIDTIDELVDGLMVRQRVDTGGDCGLDVLAKPLGVVDVIVGCGHDAGPPTIMTTIATAAASAMIQQPAMMNLDTGSVSKDFGGGRPSTHRRLI